MESKEKKVMKPGLKLFVVFAVLIIIVLVLGQLQKNEDLSRRSSTSSNYKTDTVRQKESSLSFYQKGYYKSKEKMRVFSYLVECPSSSFEGSDEYFQDLNHHGGKQMHTSGKITQVFYFTIKNNAPADRVSLANSYNIAIDVALSKNPIALFYINPDGSTGFEKNPK